MIGPVLLPFIAAFFVAWILSFPVAFAAERMHIRRRIAAVAVVLLFYGLAGLVIGFLGNRIMLLGQELLGEVVRFVSETIFPMMKHFCAWTAGLTERRWEERCCGRRVRSRRRRSAGQGSF